MRRRLPEWQRRDIAFAQEWKCRGCAELLRPTFHIDHVAELADGGADERANMQALCVECHAAKTLASTTARAERRAAPVDLAALVGGLLTSGPGFVRAADLHKRLQATTQWRTLGKAGRRRASLKWLKRHLANDPGYRARHLYRADGVRREARCVLVGRSLALVEHAEAGGRELLGRADGPAHERDREN